MSSERKTKSSKELSRKDLIGLIQKLQKQNTQLKTKCSELLHYKDDYTVDLNNLNVQLNQVRRDNKRLAAQKSIYEQQHEDDSKRILQLEQDLKNHQIFSTGGEAVKSSIPTLTKSKSEGFPATDLNSNNSNNNAGDMISMLFSQVSSQVSQVSQAVANQTSQFSVNNPNNPTNNPLINTSSIEPRNNNNTNNNNKPAFNILSNKSNVKDIHNNLNQHSNKPQNLSNISSFKQEYENKLNVRDQRITELTSEVKRLEGVVKKLRVGIETLKLRGDKPNNPNDLVVLEKKNGLKRMPVMALPVKRKSISNNSNDPNSPNNPIQTAIPTTQTDHPNNPDSSSSPVSPSSSQNHNPINNSDSPDSRDALRETNADRAAVVPAAPAPIPTTKESKLAGNEEEEKEEKDEKLNKEVGTSPDSSDSSDNLLKLSQLSEQLKVLNQEFRGKSAELSSCQHELESLRKQHQLQSDLVCMYVCI